MKMSLDSSGVKTALSKAGQSIQAFSQKAIAALDKVVKLASVSLVAAFVAAARGALDYAKEVTNLSQVANTNVVDFQKLAAAARTVGIEQEKLADIYKDMSDRVGDYLATGGGPMKDWFENIAPLVGITADEFRNLSGPEALQLYFDGLEKANASQEDMTFYLEAVASDATALIPLLAQGGQKFQQLGQDAVAGGQVMSKASIDNLKKAQDAIDAFKVKAVIKVGEIIGDGGGGLKKLGAGFMLLMGNVGDWLINSFLAAAKLLTVTLTATVAFVGIKLQQAFESAALHLQKILAPIINNLAAALGLNININIDQVDADLEKLKYSAKTFAQVFTEIDQSLGDWNINLEESLDHWRKIGESAGENLSTVEDIEKAKKRTNGLTDQAIELAKQKNILDELELEMETRKHEPMNKSKELLIEQYDEAKRLVGIMQEHKLPLDEAKRIIERQNQDLRDQKALVDAIHQAQAAGNDRLVIQLEIIKGIQERALQLQKDTNMSYSEALEYAEQEYKLKEGDFDLSGDITLEEQKQLENYRKMVEKANEKFEANQKTDSILKRSLLPSWEKNEQIHNRILRGLNTKNDVLERMKDKARNYEQAQAKVTTEVENTVYQLDKAHTTQGGVKIETDNVAISENTVSDAIEKSNEKRREAVNLVKALKNAGPHTPINVDVKHSIITDINSTLVPHLVEHTSILSSINQKLDC